MMEENKHNYDVYWNDVSIFKFTVYKKKNRPVFSPAFSPLLPAVDFKTK